MEDIIVDTFFGYKGEETPSGFLLNGIPHQVHQIVDHWYSHECRIFRVHADDGCRYVLRFHLEKEYWELVMQESPTPKKD